MRKLLNILFGINYAVFINDDGEVQVRRIHLLKTQKATYLWAGNDIYKIMLYDDFTTNKSYMPTWEYLFPPRGKK
jgi:hypothetical protein